MKLSAQQQSIVDSGEKVIMVIAGPGSGKTQVLTQRVLHELSLGVPESSILLLTFTNKAANAMLGRIERELGRRPEILGGTFHHVANIFIRQNARRLGYLPNYSIIDEADSVRLLRKVLKEEFAGTAKSLPKAEHLYRMFSYCRNSMSRLSDYLELNLKNYGSETLQIEKVYGAYARRKKAGNMVDFDDLLVLFSQLLDDEEFRSDMQRQYAHVFVDEFQDTNKLQFEIIKKLHTKEGSLFVVGDDCQSIYSFRAAEILNMLRFEAVFPSVKVFCLTENYRSTKPIISFVNEIIRKNRNKFDKQLIPVHNVGAAGTLPTAVVYEDAREEARHIVQKVLKLISSGTKPEEIAVLYRLNFQATYIEIELAKAGISYVKLGGIRFFEQAHIKDIIAFLKIISGMPDELAWERTLMMFDKVGDKTAKKIFSKIQASPNPLESFKHIQDPRLAALANLVALSERKQAPIEKAKVFIDEFYTTYLQNEYDGSEERIGDLSQLLSILSGYVTISEFLEDTMLDANLMDQKDIAGKVILSTVHQAKGLEWENVFIIGMADGRFPSKHSIEDETKLEEERRLFYVACSRAKLDLHISVPLCDDFSWGSMHDLGISRFITEQPNTVLHISCPARQYRKNTKAGCTTFYTGFVSADELLQ